MYKSHLKNRILRYIFSHHLHLLTAHAFIILIRHQPIRTAHTDGRAHRVWGGILYSTLYLPYTILYSRKYLMRELGITIIVA